MLYTFLIPSRWGRVGVWFFCLLISLFCFVLFGAGGWLFVSDGGITMSHYGKEILLPI